MAKIYHLFHHRWNFFEMPKIDHLFHRRKFGKVRESIKMPRCKMAKIDHFFHHD